MSEIPSVHVPSSMNHAHSPSNLSHAYHEPIPPTRPNNNIPPSSSTKLQPPATPRPAALRLDPVPFAEPSPANSCIFRKYEYCVVDVAQVESSPPKKVEKNNPPTEGMDEAERSSRLVKDSACTPLYQSLDAPRRQI